MKVKERLEGLARAAARRPALTISVVLALAIAGGFAALGLKPSAGTDTFVSRSSATFQATDKDHKDFGGDAVAILITEPLRDLVDSKDLATVTFLESCLAGQYAVPSEQLQAFQPAPAGAHAPYGGWSSPCGKLMKSQPVQVVYGPGTFLNQAVAAVNVGVAALLKQARDAVSSAESAAEKLAIGRGLSAKQAAAAAKSAGELEGQRQLQNLERLYLNSGISGTPRIDNAQFIDQIVFDATRGANQPKSRFTYLFPTPGSALIQVRLRASLSASQQAAAITWIRDAVKMPMFGLQHGGTYTVTGAPVVAGDLATEITGAIAGLLVAVVLVMAATLLIVFRNQLRLLPLAIALVAAGITFGVLSLTGGALTMASIAVLPILIGLAVDYAIQFQSRAQEARGDSVGARDGGGETAVARAAGETAVARAAGAAAPTIAAAALASAVGFLALLLSPVPMVRGFGLLLVVGIAIALVCALTLGSAAIVLADREGGALGASLRGAADILRELRPRTPERLRRRSRQRGGAFAVPSSRSQRVLGALAAHPGRVLALGAALAVLGWVADTQTAVQSDVTKLVPPNMPALRDLHTLERVTGVSGEIDVVVHADNVATPAVVGWMLSYERSLMAHYGYLETKGCAHSTLCPALSLPDLFSTSPNASAPTQAQINSLLGAVPRYFSQAVITPDHHDATLAFGIRLMPLSKQQRVIDYMTAQLHPPRGVTARLAGLPVLAAQANAALSSSARRLLTMLAGLLAVGIVLLIVFRTPRRAVVPLVPIALATGWSALILFATGIPLNPMSATLGALVIAISTEFSVLLAERYRQERAAGYELPDALSRTYRSTGLAVLASGITAIAGFGVLMLSSISMLRDFGFVTVIDLSVSLAGVMLVLPAVLAVSERGDLRERVRLRVALPRLRRRRRPRIA